VIDKLKLTRGLPRDADGTLTQEAQRERQELIEQFRAKVKVTFPVQSERIDLVSVSFTHQDDNLAYNVPNGLVANYITWAYQEIRTGLESNRDFLKTQVDNAKNRIKELETEESQFRTQNAGMFPEDPDALQDRVSAIRTNLEVRRLQLKSAKEELAQLESLEGSAEKSKDEPERRVEPIELEYMRLQAHLQDMKERLIAARIQYTDRHPDVRKLLENISVVEAHMKVIEPKLPPQFKGQPSVASAAELASYRAALARARSQESNLTDEIKRLEKLLVTYEERQKNYPSVRQKFLSFVNDIKEQKSETLRWEGRYNEVRMAVETQEASLNTRLDMIQPAQMQLRPSSPKLGFVLTFALVGGLAFGAALVLLFNYLDRSIRTTEDAIEAIDLPVHGVIGEIVTQRQRLKNKTKRWVVTPVVTVVILVAVALSTLSITLWLKVPEKFDEWRSAPVSFVYDNTLKQAVALLERLKY